MRQKELDTQFETTSSQKLETTIQIKSEIGSSNFKMTFIGEGDGVRYKVTSPEMSDIRFGDCLKVRGTMGRPEVKIQGETLYNFPYAEYLAKDGVYLLYRVSRAEKILECPPLSWYEKVKKFFLEKKIQITKIFLEKYDQPYAGLVAGVLIAGKGLMSPETLEVFKRVSLSHVVVLSGSNVSIIIFCIKYIFDLIFGIFKIKENKFSEIVKKFLMLILITSFVLLTGGGAPINRAFISSFCALVLFKKGTDQVYALTIVVLIMTILNPFGSLYDPSFHLTCCATYGLILFSRYFDKVMIFSWTNFIPNFLREIISVTLATQVFVFPYIIFMSGSFSTVFLLSNVLVLPLIPFIMLLGFLSLFPIVGGLCISVNNIILQTVFYLVKFLSEIPHAYILFDKKTSILILAIYSIFVLFLFWKIRSAPPPPQS
ncbi:ComEC/Rec2 family competence protein [Candidatus Parcubacteria bacterium]|nr:ComEC/Rec2 family competence protein [Candidatus Parcubacteria bacterium]